MRSSVQFRLRSIWGNCWVLFELIEEIIKTMNLSPENQQLLEEVCVAGNHLRDGAIQRYFAADPIIQRVLPLLDAERFFD